jgi:hypothetical protein
MGWHDGPWLVVIPGQPPSGNHANKIGRGFRRGGIAYPKMVKTPQAEAYQAGAALITKVARPSGWRPGDRVVMEYRFWITRDADCTNLIKTVEDAVCPALGFNDSKALPRAMSKTVGVSKHEARTEITIY